MLHRVHPHAAVGGEHARVPADDCAHIVAAHAAGGAVGHDVQANAARHEVEGSGGGGYGTNPTHPELMLRYLTGHSMIRKRPHTLFAENAAVTHSSLSDTAALLRGAGVDFLYGFRVSSSRGCRLWTPRPADRVRSNVLPVGV